VQSSWGNTRYSASANTGTVNETSAYQCRDPQEIKPDCGSSESTSSTSCFPQLHTGFPAYLPVCIWDNLCRAGITFLPRGRLAWIGLEPPVDGALGLGVPPSTRHKFPCRLSQPLVDWYTTPPECWSTLSVGVSTYPHRPHHLRPRLLCLTTTTVATIAFIISRITSNAFLTSSKFQFQSPISTPMPMLVTRQNIVSRKRHHPHSLSHRIHHQTAQLPK
jgi:hypothetical protein